MTVEAYIHQHLNKCWNMTVYKKLDDKGIMRANEGQFVPEKTITDNTHTHTKPQIRI